MKIQQFGQQDIAYKGLYFAKTTPLCNEGFNYVNKAEQKVSKQGIKYLEDKDIAANVKERISNIPFIKEMGEKFETFVVYTEKKMEKFFNKEQEEYVSIIDMHVINKQEKKSQNYVFLGRDTNSLLEARDNCLKKVDRQ